MDLYAECGTALPKTFDVDTDILEDVLANQRMVRRTNIPASWSPLGESAWQNSRIFCSRLEEHPLEAFPPYFWYFDVLALEGKNLALPGLSQVPYFRKAYGLLLEKQVPN